MAIEPPLKKRKNYDADAGHSTSQGTHVTATEALPNLPLPSAIAQQPVFTEEQKLSKKRNRDEISSFYKLYRRLKFCLDRKRNSGSGAAPTQDLEEAYCSILTLSSGCSSVQRIAAEIIPRYVAFCPSAIDLASNALIHILEWNEEVVFQETDVDGVAFKTVEACLAGMVEMSSAALNAASDVPDISDMSTAVCHNIAYYLLCRLEGRDLIKFDVNKYEEEITTCLEHALNMQEKLLVLLSFNVVKLFCLHPQSIFAACFEYLSSTNEKQRKEGQRFLKQIMGEERDENMKSKREMCVSHDEVITDVEGMDDSHNEHKDDSYSLVKKVIIANTVLERWLVSSFREFSRSAPPVAVAESSPLLTTLLQSLSSFKETDLDPFYEEVPESVEKDIAVEEASVDEDPQGAENVEGSLPLVVKSVSVPEEVVELETGGVSATNADGNEDTSASFNEPQMKKVDTLEDTDGNADEGNEKPTVNILLDKDVDGISRSGDVESGWVGSSLNGPGSDAWTCDTDSGLKNPGSIGLHEEVPSQWVSGKVGARSLVLEDLNLGARYSDTGLAGSQTLPSSNYSNEMSGYVQSPRGVPSSRIRDPFLNSGHVTWYSDGDPAALDVFAASKQLWVGSLGLGVTESLMRYEFEKFGPIESLSLFPGQDFGLVEYRSIVDAVKAREVLRGSAPWSMPLKVKFLDVGLGSRGTIGGVAVGGSCHVYIGSVFSILAKDELMKDISRACPKGPCSVYFLMSANTLLLEFVAPEEAAAAMLYVRQRRREKGFVSPQFNFSAKPAFSNEDIDSGRHLWIGHGDKPVSVSSLSSPRSSAPLYPSTSSSSAWQDLRSSIPFPPIGNNPGKTIHSPHTSGTLGFRTRGLRGTQDPERVPTNTLWVGLSDNAIHALPSDTELRTIFNLACKGAGMVTKMSSIRGVRGSCRFVEFDCVEAAASAIENCAGYLDPGTQVEFSNSLLSRQQTEFSYSTVTYQSEEPRPLWEKEQDWDRRLRSPVRLNSEDSGLGISRAHATLPTGWVQAHGRGVADDAKYRFDRYSHYDSASEIRESVLKMDPMIGRFTYKTSGDVGSLDSPRISQGSSHPWLGSARMVEHHSSLVGGLGGSAAIPQAPPLSSLPALTHPSRAQLERLPSTGSWAAQSLLSSSPIDRISSVASSTMNISVPNFSTGTMLQSSIISAMPRFLGGLSHSFDLHNPPLPPLPPMSPPPPPPPLETPPPPPPLSPPALFQVPPSPPPPASVMKPINKDTRYNSNQHRWRGPLCKSGFQYCEVLAYGQDSAVCHSEAFREPAGWPNKLDVTKRADFRSVRHSFQNTASSQRQVCRLSVCSGSNNQEGFQHFNTYLRQRDRAGVVMIPEIGKLRARVLFLLPWSREICDLLVIPQQPSDNLIGLLLPVETAFN